MRASIKTRATATRPWRARRGMTLIEVMVALAIGVGLLTLAVPTLSGMFQVKQRKAAKKLALTYTMLHDEAVLRNVTFRVAYHLNEGSYSVEVGDPAVLIFDDPEKREEFEEERADKLSRFSDDERAQAKADELSSFQALTENLAKKVTLPDGTRFGGVYTPQYGGFIEPDEQDEEPEEDEEPTVVYSYIFASGFSEHTVVHLVEERNPEVGYSVEIEPLSGRVHMSSELVDFDERFDFVPDEGPELAQ